MNTKFVDTISSINFNNGIIKLHFITQDDEEQALNTKKDTENVAPKVEYSHTVAMTLPGFIYMASIVKGLLEDPKMQKQIDQYVDLGILKKADNTNEEKGKVVELGKGS